MKQENKIETNAKSSFLNFVTATKEKKSLVDIHENNFFSHFGIHQGVQVMSKPHSLRLIGLALLGLLTSHLVGTSLIHSAYAASYVNVSSGGGNSGTSSSETVSPGIVNLGSIKPTSTGTMATGNDTLTIHTDCSAGYKVYVSGQNGKSTNLINSNAEDPENPTATELISSMPNLPDSTSATSSPSSAATLNSNTWGINGNNTEAGSNLYYGLPSYTNATAYPLVTKSDVPEESTVPIYYGVKVNTDITPGTYTGDVLYTVIMDTSCTTYNVSFNANGGTGTMDTQSILIGETKALNENTFTRSGYGFLGWSTSANGKTGTVTNGIGTPNDVEYSDESEVTNLANVGQTITLYAIWAKVDGNMQSWNGCSSLTTNQIVYLTDTRDNKTYGVKKTPDGKCWMLQNLTANHITMTPQDTNISDGRTYYLPKKNTRFATADPFNSSNTTISSDILDASNDVNFSRGFSNNVQVGYRSNGSTDNDTNLTVPEDTAYYNFYTATLGFSYYNDGKTNGSSTQDICPKGWHLPWTSDQGTTRTTTAEFYTLAYYYNTSASWSNKPNDSSTSSPYTSDGTIRKNMISGDSDSMDRFTNNGSTGFSYDGYYDGNLLSGVTEVGYYWSSSVNAVLNGYDLHFNSTSLHPQDATLKHVGRAIRCVVDNYTIQFDANGGAGTMDNQVIFGNSTTTQTIKSNTFTRTGYHFLGWSTDSSATSATYTDGQTLTTAIAENGRTIKLYAIWAPNTFTINYNSNGGSGTTNPTTATYDTNVTLATNSFTAPSGKKFKEWNTSDNGSGTSYTSGQSGIAPTTLKPDISTTNGGSITLYAIWEDDAVTFAAAGIAANSNMQNIPSGACAKVTVGQYTTLNDSRDNNKYVVKKLPDGNCWMVENLRLINKTISSSDSNVSSSFTVPTSTAAGSSWCTSDKPSCYDKPLAYYDSSTRASYGALYNWYTATAGTGKYATSSGAVSSSICPKGWRLPAGGSSGEFVALDKAWGGNGTDRNNANTYSTFTGAYTTGNNGGFDLPGFIDDDSSLYGVGSYGFWWSATASSSYYAYRLGLYSGNTFVGPQNIRSKYQGHSVRCIAST